MEYKKCKYIMMHKFFRQIGKSLSIEVEIMANIPEISIDCKYMDEVTTKEEVSEIL